MTSCIVSFRLLASFANSLFGKCANAARAAKDSTFAEPCEVDRGSLVHLSQRQPEFDELAELSLGHSKQNGRC
jgi:hypothetical protein